MVTGRTTRSPRSATAAALAVCAAWSAFATAQPDVTVYSPRADSVDITIYRDGLALVTETRTVTLPAAAATLVIEGVTDTLLPESAVIDDLDRPLVESNFDSRWLSPRTLLENSIGKTVTLVRTDPTSGRATRTTATIVAVNAGVVLETDDGFGALYCSGLPERLQFDSVPDGLLAEPRLSVRVAEGPAGPRTVKVSYLATDFEWSADYVAKLDDAGDRMTLTGWATLVNDSGVAFEQAQVQLVAGLLNVTPGTRSGGRTASSAGLSSVPPILIERMRALGTAVTAPELQRALPLTTCFANPAAGARPVYGSDASAGIVNVILDDDSDEIVVTGARIRSGERLGDYHLYRLPWRTDLGARQTKQVLFLEKHGVRVERYYSVSAQGLDIDEPLDEKLFAPAVYLRFRNSADGGIGEPLPRGTVRVFEPYRNTHVFAGEGGIPDVAVGLPVKFRIGSAADMFVEAEWSTTFRDRRSGEAYERDLRYRIVSAKQVPVAFEVRQDGGYGVTDLRVSNASHRPRRERGEFVFDFEVAPGEEWLSYTLSGRDPPRPQR